MIGARRIAAWGILLSVGLPLAVVGAAAKKLYGKVEKLVDALDPSEKVDPPAEFPNG